MARSSVLLLVLISAFALSNAFTNLVAPGKELVYDYHARLRAGTYQPAMFASQFILQGKLRMQNEAGGVMMRLTDLQYKLYNGELNDHDELDLNVLDFPAEASDIMKPFKVMYEEDKVKYLATDMQEKKFSRNFKKALASIMQLDMKQIKTDLTMPQTFVTNEDSIYGKGLVRCAVIPEGSDEVIVKKLIDVQKMRQWYTFFGTTDESQLLSMHDEVDKPLSMDAHREYLLKKDSAGLHVKEIKAHGGVYMHMFKGFSETYYIQVNQTMTLVETIPIKEKLAMGGEEQKEELAFNPEFKRDSETMNDLTLERSHLKMADYETMVYEGLDNMVKYMDDTKLEMERPDLKKSQAINHLVHVMQLLDVATLEQIFAKMQEKTGDHDKKMFATFQEMVPLVGSRATVVFVRNIIRKQKVSDKMAMCMLRKLPFHIRKISAKLLIEMEDLMSLEGVSKPVHRTAVLCFSSMVYKMYAHDKIQDPNVEKRTDMELLKEDLLEKYILKFMTLLKGSQDYSTQYLYMCALYNIKIGNVAKYLEPYVKGVATTNRHIRYLAMCASFAGAIKDQSKVFEVYAPILADRSLHLELRAGAYFIIMNANPGMQKMWDMYWVMKDEPCPHLYHLHYTYLKSMMYTTLPELQEMKVFANQVINYMRKPYTHTLTGFYMSDYTDPKYGFGAKSETMLLLTNSSKAIYLDLSSRMYNAPTGHYAFWLKFDGLDHSKIKMPNTMKMLDNEVSFVDQIWKMVSALKDQANVHIEYAIFNHDKIIQLECFDHANVDKFVRMLEEKKEQMFLFTPPHISYDMITQRVVPNDLGTPVFVECMLPYINNNRIKVMDEKLDGSTMKKVELRLQYSKHLFFGLTTYNPIADMWHGVKRVYSFDFKLPLDIKLATSKQPNLKITMNLPKDQAVMGMRNYVTTLTFIYGDRSKMLEKSSKVSKPFMIVSRGDNYRTAKVLFEWDCIHTGLKFEYAVYDTRRAASRHVLEMIKEHVSERFFKNYQMMPMGEKLLTLGNMLAYNLVSPRVGTLGFLVRLKPSTVYPIDHIDASLRYNLEMIPQEGMKLSNKKLSTRATWSTETADHKVINMWDMNMVLEGNPGNLDNKYKVQLTKMLKDKKPAKICIDITQKFVGKEVTGNMVMKVGEVADSKMCPENSFELDVNAKGGISDEQIWMRDNNVLYLECLPQHMYEPMLKDVHATCHHETKCIQKYTTMRKYEYDLKWKQTNKFVTSHYIWFLHYIKGHYYPYFSYDEANTGVEENNCKLVLEFPQIGGEVNATMTKSKSIMKLIEAPTKGMWLGGKPFSYHYTSLFRVLQTLQMTKTCLVTGDKIYDDFYDVKPMNSKEWMLVLQNNPAMQTNKKMELFVKKIDGKKDLAMKLVILGEPLEIIPNGNEYKITYNNKPMTVEQNAYINEKLFSIGVMKDKHDTVIIGIHDFGMYLDFDGTKLRVEKHRLGHQFTGLCFNL